MNYDRIILELMERIKILEEKVAILENCREADAKQKGEQAAPAKANLTADARAYIVMRKDLAKQEGLSELVLVCNDIQKALGASNRAPAICTAMYDCMTDGDEVVFAPPSGKSTTVTVKYYIGG